MNLHDLAKLVDGWHGPKSKAPTAEALATADNMTPCPTADGGLQLELHAGGADIEIGIAPDGTVYEIVWSKKP